MTSNLAWRSSSNNTLGHTGIGVSASAAISCSFSLKRSTTAIDVRQWTVKKPPGVAQGQKHCYDIATATGVQNPKRALL